MDEVSKNDRLQQRGTVFQYRRRVPDDLVTVLKKVEIKYSLKTSDVKEARSLRELHDVRWSAEFAMLRGGGSQIKPTLGSNMEVLVRAYVDRELKRIRANRSKDPIYTDEERRDVIQDAEFEISEVASDTPQGKEWVAVEANKIFSAEGKQSLNALSNTQHYDLVKRALIEVQRMRIRELNGHFDKSNIDQLFSPTHVAQITFGELAAEYLKKRLAEAKINEHSAKYSDKIEQTLNLVIELVGADTPMNDIDYNRCEELRFKLAKFPSNRNKLYRGLAVSAVIEKAAKDKAKILSPVTQISHLGLLKSILQWATDKKLIATNPAFSIAPVKKDKSGAAEKRYPFEMEQLQRFFTSAFYKKCASPTGSPYSQNNKSWRFWLPLICLFTGMRANEVCQLLTTDIKITIAGTPYIEVTDVLDEVTKSVSGSLSKRVKNAGSKRKIPIHEELIKLGFINFVSARRKAKGEARLFANIKPDKYGYLSTYPTRRFNETFLQSEMGLKQRQSFHSFRHTFRDALRRTDATPDTLQALGGWIQDKLVSSDYGTISQPDHQLKWLNKVKYEGLNLDHLSSVDWTK